MLTVEEVREMITEERKNALHKIEKEIGVTFSDISLLNTALTHSSFANESGGDETHNERMEFLGDSALSFIVASYLYEKYKKTPEGKLTAFRSGIVCSKSLASAAKDLGIGEALRFGHGEEAHGGKNKQSNLEDAFEAVLGAIYLDKGIDVARDFVLRVFKEELTEKNHLKPIEDFKSQFLEIIQREKGHEFEFILTDESGPPHDKDFFVAVELDGKIVGRGEGKSKKAAEQMAAKEAIKKLKI